MIRYEGNLNVLDVGCGLGFPLTEIAMRLGSSSKVFGIDPWRAGLGRIKHKSRVYELSNVTVIEGRAECMPFVGDSFDLIVSNNGMNNVGDLEEALSECRRVMRRSAQFVFNFNTEQTFSEFYRVFRDVLGDLGLSKYEQKLSEHIHSKRRPVSEFHELLGKNGFRINTELEDLFHYRFFDATALLKHFFIRLAFIPSWKNVVPVDVQEEVFSRIEMKLNSASKDSRGLSMQVPFVTFDCEKI